MYSLKKENIAARVFGLLQQEKLAKMNFNVIPQKGKHSCQGVWLIAARKALKIFSETADQNPKSFGRNGN